MLEIKDVELIKQNKKMGIKILKNISLKIPKNRITLLLGKSGSGKTSLLRCVSQLEKGYTGEISYQSKSLYRLSPRQRCDIIGFLPQSFPLFPYMNALNNCAFSMRTLLKYKKKEAYDKAEELIYSLGMQEYMNNYPHELSGGQQQRIAIARALALNPTFLLFDEPTSALDPENTEIFIEILENLLKGGKGIIISSQDMYFAKNILDQVCFLENGEIVEIYHHLDSKMSTDSKLHRFLFEKNSAYTSLER